MRRAVESWHLHPVKTQIEYRISEQIAQTVFDPSEGKRITDSVRAVTIDASDHRWPLLVNLYTAGHGAGFFSWQIRRSYSPSETESAKLHLLRVNTNVRPTEEQCGTLYDNTETCPLCGAGRVQTSPLRLNLSEGPQIAEIAETWAGEVIVSRRVVRLLIDSGMTGFGLGPVQRSKRGAEEPFTLSETESGRRLLVAASTANIQYPSPEFYVWINRLEQDSLFRRVIDEHENKKLRGRRKLGGTTSQWFQLFVTSKPVELAPPTLFGKNPLDHDSEGPNKCPVGLAEHVIGLNLLSQPTVRVPKGPDTDFLRSTGLVGVRRGLYAPKHLWFISPRLRDLLRANFVRGWSSEVAELQEN